MSEDPCTICQLENQPTGYGSTDKSFRTTCLRCGEYEWHDTASTHGRSKRIAKMSGYVQDQNAAGIVPIFTRDLVSMVERMAIPPLRDRASRLLAAIVKDVGYDVGSMFMFNDQPRLLAVSYSESLEELAFLLQLLSHDSFMVCNGFMGSLTAAGCLEAEELQQRRPSTVQGFVAMSFDPSLDEAYAQGFDPGIRAAGYRPLRIDAKEHAGSISDAIISEIRRSRFLIADYTGSNNGVYFEAGFALGLGIPVIPTCHADWLSKLHFDIRHINTLKWDTPQQLAEGLAHRLSAVLGDGPLPKPTPTQA